MPWWGNKHLSDLIVPFEECMWTMLYFKKKSPCYWDAKMEWDGYVSELFYFSTTQEDLLATPHIPQVWGMFWDNLYDSSTSWIAMFMFTLSSTFTQDEQRS